MRGSNGGRDRAKLQHTRRGSLDTSASAWPFYGPVSSHLSSFEILAQNWREHVRLGKYKEINENKIKKNEKRARSNELLNRF